MKSCHGDFSFICKYVQCIYIHITQQRLIAAQKFILKVTSKMQK